MDRGIYRVLYAAAVVLGMGCGVSVENATPMVVNWSDTGQYTIRARVSTSDAVVERARALLDNGSTVDLSEGTDDLWEGTLRLPRCAEGFGLSYSVDWHVNNQQNTQTVNEPQSGVLLFRVRGLPSDCPPGSRREFVVDDLGDAVDVTPGDGVCATSGRDCTLRAAVMEANALPGANSVLLPQGTITLSLTEGSNRFTIPITDNLTIRGDPPDESQQIRSAITVDPDAGEEAVQAGFGFGFFNVSGAVDGDISVSIDAVRMQGGFGLYGGALRNGASLIVRRSHIQNNVRVVQGGAIYNSGDLTLEDSWVHDNSAGEGGGIYNFGTVLLRSSTLSANSASRRGGAIYAYLGRVELWNSTVSGNLSSEGAGLDLQYPVTALLRNSTLTLNRADERGGGVLAETEVAIDIGHTLIAGNVAGDTGTSDADGELYSLGSNLVGICSNASSQPCTLTPTVTSDSFGSLAAPLSPVLFPLFGDGVFTPVHAPHAGSPAVDAGSDDANNANATACTRVDQLGRGRPRNGVCDIGAVEL